MTVYYPRMEAKLVVPVFGSAAEKDQLARGLNTVTVPVRLEKATLERNDHRTADVLNITAEWRDCGIDPRFLRHATCDFWMANVPDGGELEISKDTHRFAGVATSVKRIAKTDGGFQVDMEFADYTVMFLDCKPYNPKAVPTYTMTLREAWEMICDNTGWYDTSTGKIQSSVQQLRDRLIFKGVSESLALTAAAPNRFHAIATIPFKTGSSAWDLWQTICGMLGLITYMDADRCIVTTTTEHFSAHTTWGDDRINGAPSLIWGHNVLESEENAKSQHENKGILLTSFNPLTGEVLESYYPRPGDTRIKVKRSVARRKGYKTTDLQSDQYEPYEYNMVITQEQLDAVAEAAYYERSRQSFEGNLKTAELFVEDADGTTYDLLELKSGDAIQIKIDPVDKELVGQQGTDATTGGGDKAAQIEFLMDYGYTREIATLVVANLEGYQTLPSTFHVTKVRFELGEDKYQCEITYHNLINPLGEALDTYKR